MSIQTGDHAVDEVLAGLQQSMGELRRIVQQVRRLLDRRQRGRASLEDLRDLRRQHPGVDRALPRPDDRTAESEFAALQAYERQLTARVHEQQEQIARLEREREQILADDFDQDGIPNQRERTLEDQAAAAADERVDDAVEERDEDRAEEERDEDRADEEREEDRAEDERAEDREEDRERRAEREAAEREEARSGVDPLAAGAAVGAAEVVAEGIDEEREQQELADAAEDADADREESAADNLEQTGADNAQGTDPNTTDADRGQETDPAINPDQQADAQVANEPVDPSQAADNQLDPEAPQADASAYETDNPTLDQATDLENAGQDTGVESAEQGTGLESAGQGTGADSELDSDVAADGGDLDGVESSVDGQDTDLATDQDGPSQYVTETGPGVDNTQDLTQDETDLGENLQPQGQGTELGQDTEVGQQAENGQQPQETLEQPSFPTAGDQEASNRVEAQSQGTEQGANAPATDVETTTPEQTSDQGQQPVQQTQGPQTPGVQDVAAASASAVEAEAEAPGQGGAPSGQGNQAQTQQPQHAEDKLLDGNRGQHEPGPEIPDEEKAGLVDKTSKGHAHASGATDRDAGVSTGAGERPGTAAQQARDRTADRDRGRNDDGGRGRG
jgi:hypothetical protein